MNKNQLRGRKYPPSKKEMRFWDKFPELLLDDSEEEHNELIGKLRSVAVEHFKDEEAK